MIGVHGSSEESRVLGAGLCERSSEHDAQVNRGSGIPPGGASSVGSPSSFGSQTGMQAPGAFQPMSPVAPFPGTRTTAVKPLHGSQAAGPFGASLSPPPQPPAQASAFVRSTAAPGTSGSDTFKDAPAYVTTMASDFMKMSTVLESELGPIRAPIRPIRSAAGRLDLLGGDDSEDDLGDVQTVDIQGPYSLSSSAGLVSFCPPVFGNASAPRGSVDEQTRSLGKDLGATSGDRATSSGATSAGSSQMGLSSHASNGGLGSTNDGAWELPWTNTASEDVWQVKNTFLTLSPQVKPIRSVRTAEGALCALSSLLDDEG